jgi:hypothetical protein
MRFSALESRSGLRPGAIVALVALGAFWASEAHAGCSNHSVTTRYELTAKAADLELLRLAGAVPSGPAEDFQKAPIPSPCTGAMCSGHPASAPAPISSGPPADDGEWALGALRVSPACPGALYWARDNATLRSINRTRSIFHPPRAHVVTTSF